MQERLNHFKADPVLLKAVLDLNTAVQSCGLDASLLHLVKLRASQINGCSYCVEMHTREARQDGETEQRLYLVSAWRDSPLFSARERAALHWTEQLTRLADAHITDEHVEAMKDIFSKAEITQLTVAIGMINIWNRLAISAALQHPHEQAA